MKAVHAGAAARRCLVPDAQGTVLASTGRAWYLDLPAGIAAVVGPDVHPGPLHLCIDEPLGPVPPGAPVAVRESLLVVHGEAVGLEDASAWMGALPTDAFTSGAAEVMLAALEAAARMSPLGALGDRAQLGLACLSVGDVEGAATRLAGLGPGLTPAGDDALAGAVLGLRALGGPPSEPGLLGLVEGLPTGRISLAFLEWAARGQALAPVHDLLVASALRDPEGARSAVTALGAVGASSGADFTAGLAAMVRGVLDGSIATVGSIGRGSLPQRQAASMPVDPSSASSRAASGIGTGA